MRPKFELKYGQQFATNGGRVFCPQKYLTTLP